MKSVKLLAGALLFIATGCSSVKLALNEPDWTNKTEYAVKGRTGFLINQKLSFAEFNTDKVNRSWTSSPSWGIGVANGQTGFSLSAEFIKSHQTYSYQLADSGQNQVQVACAVNVRKNDLVIGNQGSTFLNAASEVLRVDVIRQNNLYMQLWNKGDAQPWQLLLDNNKADLKSKEYTGYVYQSPANYYTVVPLKNIQNNKGKQIKMFDLAGFEIRNKDNKPVAAVSLIDNGAVYFANVSGSERLLLAGICSALLLQQDIS